MAERLSLEAMKQGAVAPAGRREELHRLRLMIGMAEAVAEKGYAGATIGDVVRHARVSRRTFYEQFPDKEACFLAAYDFFADIVMTEIAEAAGRDLPWNERLLAGVDAYLEGMVREPALTRVFGIEILGAGPRALERRRAVHEQFAELLRALVDQAREDHPELQELSPEVSLALIAGINELVMLSVQGAASESEIFRLRDAAAQLVESVIAAPVRRGAVAG